GILRRRFGYDRSQLRRWVSGSFWGVAVAEKRARAALALAGFLMAAGGVAVNRVGGSGWQRFAVFAVVCVSFVRAGMAAQGGGDRGWGLRWRPAGLKGRQRQLGEV